MFKDPTKHDRYPVQHMFLACCVLLFLAMSPAVVAETAGSAAHADLDSFSLLWERNIFDPERRADTPAAEPVRVEPQPRQLQLLGVLLSNESTVAFFSGTEYAFNTTASPGDRVDVFQIKAIGIDAVTLLQEQDEYVLQVGAMLSDQATCDWSVIDNALTLPPQPATAAESVVSVEEPSKANPADEKLGSLLEKLKARRKQELE